MTTLISKNVAIGSNFNYKQLLNFCVEYFAPTFNLITVIIAHGNNLRIYFLKKSSFSGFDVTYICQCSEPINELIFYNHENFKTFLLIDKNNEIQETLIPKELKSKMEIHELILSSNPSTSLPSSNSYQFNFNNGYRDFAYHEHPPPPFDSCCNFEAMIYYALNTTKIFMGETIAILVPKLKEIYIYIFRRILLHFLLESYFVVTSDFEITTNFLHFPEQIIKIIVKPFPNLKLPEKCHELKNLPEILKEGFEIYEKAKNEKSLAICGTTKYIEAVKEAKKKNLLKPFYLDTVPQIIITNEMKKAVIEIKNDSMRLCIMAKINSKRSDIIFAYPDNENFIPMYISFLRETVIIGKQAQKDYKNNPKFVVFDILKVAGKTMSNPPDNNELQGFQLAPIGISHDSKLGFKVQTFDGIKIFPVEILLAILFKYLLKNIASDYIQSTEFTLRIIEKKLSPTVKNVLWAVSKMLNFSMKLECIN